MPQATVCYASLWRFTLSTAALRDGFTRLQLQEPLLPAEDGDKFFDMFFFRILMNFVLLHKCFRARKHFLSFLLPNSKSLLSRAVTITKRRTFNLSKILKHYTSL